MIIFYPNVFCLKLFFSYRQQGQSAAIPAPTLDFANLCLSNALLLMPSERDLETAMMTCLQNERVVPGADDKE